MKELFYKLFGLEPMSAADVEAVCELPVVLIFGVLCIGAAVLLG